MKADKLLGRREDVAEILKRLGIKEGAKPNLPLVMLADEGAMKGQEGWINYFNEMGEVMASIADIYYAAKNADKETLKSLQETCQSNQGIVTSTRLEAKKWNKLAKVTDYYGSTIISPYERGIIIPYFDNERVYKALSSEEGLQYFKSLLNTEEGKEEIFSNLTLLFGTEQIVVFPADPTLLHTVQILNRPQKTGFVQHSTKGYRGYAYSIWKK